MLKRAGGWFTPSEEYRARNRRIRSFGLVYGYGILAYGLIPVLLDLNARSESWNPKVRLYFWIAYLVVAAILMLIYLGYGVVSAIRNVQVGRRDLRAWRSRHGDEESPPPDGI